MSKPPRRVDGKANPEQEQSNEDYLRQSQCAGEPAELTYADSCTQNFFEPTAEPRSPSLTPDGLQAASDCSVPSQKILGFCRR